MRPLSDCDILEIWERAQTQHPIDRALTLLKRGFPGATWEELVNLTVGQRNRRLLVLREGTLGSRLMGFSECPACGVALDFMLRTEDLLAADSEPRSDQEQTVRVDGFEVSYRCPNSQDLAAIVSCEHVTAARKLLMKRCVNRVTHKGVDLGIESAPGDVIATVVEEIVKSDTFAELEIDLCCPDCGHQWLMPLDIVAFFWEEISAKANRLLEEVHTLALAYGWNEMDILSMSVRRRRFYFEMVT